MIRNALAFLAAVVASAVLAALIAFPEQKTVFVNSVREIPIVHEFPVFIERPIKHKRRVKPDPWKGIR